MHSSQIEQVNQFWAANSSKHGGADIFSGGQRTESVIVVTHLMWGGGKAAREAVKQNEEVECTL